MGVCGFPRCGSTMVMTMLDRGGLRPVEGSAPASYELPWLGLAELAAVELGGRAVKLLDGAQHGMIPFRAGGWRFIWLDRSGREQAKSMVKFLGAVAPEIGMGPDPVGTLARSFKDDRAKCLRVLGEHGPVLLLEFEKILADPLGQAREIAGFLRPDFPDVADNNFPFRAASAVIERDARCRPDLAIEVAAVRTANRGSDE